MGAVGVHDCYYRILLRPVCHFVGDGDELAPELLVQERVLDTVISLDENGVADFYFSARGDTGFCVFPEGREVFVGEIKGVGGEGGER